MSIEVIVCLMMSSGEYLQKKNIPTNNSLMEIEVLAKLMLLVGSQGCSPKESASLLPVEIDLHSNVGALSP